MMISTTQPTLRQATVTGLKDVSLLPGDVPPSENISIFYDDIQPGDVMTWRWRTSSALAVYTQRVVILDPGVQRLTIPLRLVYASAGLPATLDYTVERGSLVMDAYPTPFFVIGTAELEPRIDSVFDGSGRPVANGEVSEATAFTLSGKAMGDSRVEVRDQSGVKGTVAVDDSGAWTCTLTGLEPDTHAFFVRALYGLGPISATWVVQKPRDSLIPERPPNPNA